MMVNLLMYHAGMPDAKPEDQRARRNLGGHCRFLVPDNTQKILTEI